MIGALYRWAYVLCVHTGLRAAFNRARSRLDRRECAVTIFAGTRLRPVGIGTMRVFVHAGPRLGPGGTSPRHGMISLRREQPNVARLVYRYLCMTSHFGCGQLEIAFYEAGGRVTIYGVRDVARSNAARLGWRGISRRLGSAGDDVRVVRALVARLALAGLAVRVAPAPECIDLAMNRRLVHPRTFQRTRDALERKYRRLSGALDFSGGTDTTPSPSAHEPA